MEKRRVIFLIGLTLILFTTLAQNSKKMSELERLRKATQEQIAETNRMLSTTKTSAVNSLNQLNVLTQEIKSRRRLISTLNAEIDGITAQQRRLTKEIGQLEVDLNGKKDKYAIAVRNLYQRQRGMSEMVYILSANSFQQSYRRMRYLQEYSNWRKRQAEEIISKQTELSDKRLALEQAKADKMALLTERKTENEILRKKEDDQKVIVADLQKRQKQLQAELKKQEQESKNLDRQIQKLIEDEARKSASKKDGKANTKGGYTMDQSETQLAGSFEKNKGKLPYPVNGSYVVVGRFGKQKHPQFKHVEITNAGIDLQTKPGAEARSVFDGVVSKVFLVPGFNSSVIIRHGNYISVYTNLSEVYVKVGDKVNTKQSLGKIYVDTEAGNITKMQFQIWKETVKLDPELWLGK